MANLMTAAMRMCLTADRERLVPAGSEEAAFLYASVGDDIPESAVERFGLVHGCLPGTPEAEAAAAAEQAEAAAKQAEEEAAAAAAAKQAEEEAAAAAAAAADKDASGDGADKGAAKGRKAKG